MQNMSRPGSVSLPPHLCTNGCAGVGIEPAAAARLQAPHCKLEPNRGQYPLTSCYFILAFTVLKITIETVLVVCAIQVGVNCIDAVSLALYCSISSSPSKFNPKVQVEKASVEEALRLKEASVRHR